LSDKQVLRNFVNGEHTDAADGRTPFAGGEGWLPTAEAHRDRYANRYTPRGSSLEARQNLLDGG